LFGPDVNQVPDTNQSYQRKDTVGLVSLAVSSSILANSNYKNGANDLQEHPDQGMMGNGEPSTGRFAVYRTAWKDSTGYILRNEGAGTVLRLKSFYKTEGTVGDPFVNIRKLPDMIGSTKVEGELVAMNNGIFFFNNTGSISAYNDVSGVWETGGPSSNSASFRTLQDSSKDNYNSASNTLLATSDGDRVAYLSFDYSTSAFIKFNGADLTYSNMGSRPLGEQWIMQVY
jgi:hypothetical protein